VLEFDLPASGFASMALREILKMEMKKETIEIPTPLLELNQKRPAANDLQIKETNDNPCPIKAISEHPVSEIENCGLDSPSTSGLCQASPPRKIKLESGALDEHLSMDSPLGKKVKPVAADKKPKMVKKAACPKKAKAVSKKAPAAATRKQTKKTQVKKEPAANEQPAAITKDSSEELQKNRIIVESSPSMPQLIENECFDETQTKCVKEEPGINRTRSSTFIESCAEEPAEKKIKADPEAKQKEFPSKVSKFKSIIYVDLSSDEEN
jgi:hypothetical protein